MEENNNGYVIGLIGAVVGAIVGAIPYIVIYTQFEYIVEFLTFLIPAASFYGYKIANGVMNRKIILFITIISFIIFTVFQLFLAPLWMLRMEGFSASIANLKFLYASSEFSNAMTHDYLIGLLFTVIGIVVIAININQALKGGENPQEIKLTGNMLNEQDNDLINTLIAMQAVDKYSAVEKDVLQTEMGSAFSSTAFRKLRMQQIIRKKKGKFYFSQKAKDSFLYRFALIYGKVLLFVLLIMFVFSLILILVL